MIRYKQRQWNQTNYYHLDCVAKPCRQAYRLGEFINSQMARSTEISEMCVSTPQDERNQTLEMRDPDISYIETKNTNHKKLTNKQKPCDRQIDKGAVFRHWYDLARELGYCSGQEMREGEQFVCLSGSWEKGDSVRRI